MSEVKKSAKQPVYEQIIKDLYDQILSGALRPHDPIPSVRALARKMQVNPNTVQKAYTVLMRRGAIYSVAGKGNFVADNTSLLHAEARENILQQFRALTREAKSAGVWIDELLSTVDAAYSEN